MSNPDELPEFRRIVTGHNEQQRAVIATAGAPPNVHALKAVPGTVFYEIWRTASMPVPIANENDPTDCPLQLSPPANGSLIRVVDIPPDAIQNAISDDDAAAAFAEIGQADALTDSTHRDQTAHPVSENEASSKHKLMHRTETLDYGILLSGELWMVLDDEEIHLKEGDIVVQRGTNHAWSNRSDTTARMVFILLDGEFSF